jgi:hypothetical protein
MEDLSKTSQSETDSKGTNSNKVSRKKSKKIGFTAVEAKPSEVGPHNPQQALEHLGHMLLGVEAKPTGRAGRLALEASRPAEADTKKAEHKMSPVLDKRVETLSRTELLNLSEEIVVDGSSLRQIYETHLIGEHGLRRLVGEHFRGGDLKKALRREIIEREIDFERDPAVRDMVPDQAASSSGGGANTALNQLLEKATASVNDDAEEVAFFKARARYEASQLQQHKKQRQLIDFVIAIALIILVALVIAMYLSRN